MKIETLIHDRPWLIHPDQLHLQIERVLAHKTCPTPRQMARSRKKRIQEAKDSPARAVQAFGDGSLHPSEAAAEQSNPSKAIRSVGGRIGLIGIHGPVQQRMSSELEKAEGTPLDYVDYAFDALMDDTSVEAIILHFDTPGGGIFGLQELADKIYQARGQKKCYGMVDSMACSAGYWLASACETLICTPGGLVGSVGVYMIHVDQSKALEEEGIKVSVVKAGKYKAERTSSEPLSDDARDFMQETVDKDYALFCKTLSRNRNCSVADVRANFGQGRTVDADAALAANMIDRCMSFGELMTKLMGSKSSQASGGRRAAETEVLRLRHLHQIQTAT